MHIFQRKVSRVRGVVLVVCGGLMLVLGAWPIGVEAQTTSRVNVERGGGAGNGENNEYSISADGRFLAFESDATNLVPGDTNGVTDIFVHDRQTGSTTRISVATGGSQGNGPSNQETALSSDGRVVVFHSEATNLVPGDTNGIEDIFVHDRQTGITTRVSVATGGGQALWNGQPNIGTSENASMSADGRFVAFDSFANNLVPGDTNGQYDIFVHDRQSGVTTRVSVATGGGQANDGGGHSQLSADGRIVAFDSEATNLVPGDTNGIEDIFVHDRQTGITTRVSVATGGGQANGESGNPVLSGDGRYVAFPSEATNLVPGDSNGVQDVFVHDRQTRVTTRVSVPTGGGQAFGGGIDGSGNPRLNENGRIVAFDSAATNLVPGDTNGDEDVFIHDRQTGATTRVSVATGGGQGNGSSSGGWLNQDGRLVIFSSDASNLVPSDTNGVADFFVHELMGSPGLPQVTVPNVVGQSQAAAEAAITSAGLAAGAITTAHSNSVPAGQVISQTPSGGSTVAEGTAVALTISSGLPLPDLFLSNVRVTQAVFGTDKLVLNRKTAIMANVESLGGNFSGSALVGAKIGDQLVNLVSVIFATGETQMPVELFFTPRNEGLNQALIVTVDPNNQINEANEGNNRSIPQVFEVVETKQLVIPSMLIRHPDCTTNPLEPCEQAQANLDASINVSNQFMWDIYPLANGVNPLKKENISVIGSIKITLGEKEGPCGKATVAKGVYIDTLKIDHLRARFGGKRGIGFISKDYFEFHDLPKIAQGIRLGGNSVLVEVGSDTLVAAHEIAHTFGLPEGYVGCFFPSKITVDGYQVRDNQEISGRFDFMDVPEPNDQKAWISKQNWDILTEKLRETAADPALLMISGLLHRDGRIELSPWSSFTGIPDFIEPGQYSIIMKNQDGTTLNNIPFAADFTMNIDPIGVVQTDIALLSFAVPYSAETTIVQIVGPNAEILLEIDPIQKNLNDGVEAIPEQCFISSPTDDRTFLRNALSDIQMLLDNSNIVAAITKLQESRSFTENALEDDCAIQDPLATTKERILPLMDDSIERLNARIVEVPIVPGDLNGDGTIDMADFQLFLATFGKCEGQAGYNPKANFDSDTCVTFVDYQTWYGLFVAQQ